MNPILVAFQSSDYLPYGCGGNPDFTAEKAAHSPGLNVLGAVCGNGESIVTLHYVSIDFNATYLTGQKLPLFFIPGRFNQHKYNAWHRNSLLPWVNQTWDGRHDVARPLWYQHDGAKPHTTELVNTIFST